MKFYKCDFNLVLSPGQFPHDCVNKLFEFGPNFLFKVNIQKMLKQMFTCLSQIRKMIFNWWRYSIAWSYACWWIFDIWMPKLIDELLEGSFSLVNQSSNWGWFWLWSFNWCFSVRKLWIKVQDFWRRFRLLTKQPA